MKPKSKKGLESDSIKTLSTSMKPSKRRSAESQVKKSPVSVQMLNVLDGNKGRDSQAETSLQSRGRIRRQKAVVKLTDADNSQVRYRIYIHSSESVSIAGHWWRRVLLPLLREQVHIVQPRQLHLQLPGAARGLREVGTEVGTEVSGQETDLKPRVFHPRHSEDYGLQM